MANLYLLERQVIMQQHVTPDRAGLGPEAPRLGLGGDAARSLASVARRVAPLAPRRVGPWLSHLVAGGRVGPARL